MNYETTQKHLVMKSRDQNFSRFKYPAKFIVKNRFILEKLFDFYTQLIVYAPSKYYIKQSKSLANTFDNDLIPFDKYKTKKLLQSLALLRCLEVPDSEFIRIGPYRDGGYVVYKRLEKIVKVISIGVAEDTAFEEDFLELNPKIFFFLFDHTVTPKKILPTNFKFYPLGLARSNESCFVNLDYIANTCIFDGEKALLKIDIEGSEYEALSDSNELVFSKFEQILIELHDLNSETLLSYAFIDLLKKIRLSFHLVHIHGNNNDGYTIVGGAAIPKTLELTFLNKEFEVKEIVGSAIFPRTLDYPNTFGDDLNIGAFKFQIPN